MRLEDLRGTHIGDGALFLPSNHEPFAAAFHHHAEQAQWHTINCLVRLSGDPVDGVPNERIAVVEWWRTVESLIALIHVVALLESEYGLRPAQERLTGSRRDGALDRWKAIARWFSDSKDSPTSSITGRLSELRDFRNSFEHTSRQAEIEIRHSRLGAVPANANLSDAMEAMAICVEVAAIVRYVVTGLDLMPQCIAPSKDHLFYLPLDDLAENLIFPAYHRLVSALDLETDIAPYPTPPPLSGGSIIQPQMAMKVLPDGTDVRLAEPLGIWEMFEDFAGARPECPPAGQLRLPAYARA